MKIVTWNTELIPIAGRQRFLEIAEATLDFDFLSFRNGHESVRQVRDRLLDNSR